MEAKRPEANVAPSRTTVASGWTGSSSGCARNLAIGSAPGLPRCSILSPPRGAKNLGKLIHAPVRDNINSGTAIQKRSEEHTSELQSLMRISYAVFCLKKKNIQKPTI